MPYIGKSPVGGGFHKLDNLTASATATYALTLGSAAYYPETANQLLVSLNGVIQAPQDSFTVSGSNLIFDSALTASDSIDFVVALGDVLGVGSVTDGAVTTNKIANGAVTAAKLAAGVQGVAGISSSSTSGTALSIDANNIVTTPEVPRFKSLITTNTSVPATSTKMPIRNDYGATNVNYATRTGTNYGGGFDNTNNKYVVPVTGLWQLNAHFSYFNNNTPARETELQIWVDGSVQYDLLWIGSHNDGNSYPDYDGTSGAGIAYLTAGQELELYVYTTESVTAFGYTGLSGYLIG